MMKNVAANVRFWIAGTAVAIGGAVLARVVAPSCAGSLRLVLTVGGQLLALGGLFIICLGVRRRIQNSQQ
jgi:hypothetical protein